MRHPSQSTLGIARVRRLSVAGRLRVPHETPAGSLRLYVAGSFNGELRAHCAGLPMPLSAESEQGRLKLFTAAYILPIE